MRAFRRTLVAVLAILALLLAAAVPAAATTRAEKLDVLSHWTQTSVTSQNSWLDARAHEATWADYGFDWSTDYCSGGPDQPLGFDFRMPCARHDFGYRNYKAMAVFAANKARLDSAFYTDLKRRCATYNAVTRPACLSLAWTYYAAVEEFGSVRPLSQAELNRAAALAR
jgi:Prokaryotic phospholipase A2